MKQKMGRIVTDIVFIAIVFALTDRIMIDVLKTDRIWPEVLVYLAIYAALSGVRWLIQRVWRRLTNRTDDIETDTENDTEKE